MKRVIILLILLLIPTLSNGCKTAIKPINPDNKVVILKSYALYTVFPFGNTKLVINFQIENPGYEDMDRIYNVVSNFYSQKYGKKYLFLNTRVLGVPEMDWYTWPSGQAKGVKITSIWLNCNYGCNNIELLKELLEEILPQI